MPVIAGKIHTTEIKNPIVIPLTAPCPEMIALKLIIARKCTTAVPPNIKGALILIGKLLGLFFNSPRKWFHSNNDLDEDVIIALIDLRNRNG